MKALTICVAVMCLLFIIQVPAVCENEEPQEGQTPVEKANPIWERYLAIPEWGSFTVGVAYTIEDDVPETVKNRMVSKIKGGLRSLGDVNVVSLDSSDLLAPPINYQIMIHVMRVEETPLYLFSAILLRLPNIFYVERSMLMNRKDEEKLDSSEMARQLDLISGNYGWQYVYDTLGYAGEDRIASLLEGFVATFDVQGFEPVREAKRKSESAQDSQDKDSD